jgi:LysM repeat protein
MRIIDSTRVSMGWNNPRQTRRENQIKKIGIHHSATATGSRQAFENFWRSKGWRNGGYSEIIHQNGDVEICYVPTVVTNGVGGHNTPTYNICAVGNYRVNGAQPSAAQMRSLLERIRFNQARFNVPTKKVKGHNEFLGHGSNICSGMRMQDIRNQLTRPAQPNPPSTNNTTTTHVIQHGDTFWSLSQRWNVTVDAIVRANPGVKASNLQIGQRINRPTTSNQAASTVPAIRVNGRVRVNNNASTWLTGQPIPALVRGELYTVQQLRNNNTEVLIGRDGVATGWIRAREVTPV